VTTDDQYRTAYRAMKEHLRTCMTGCAPIGVHTWQQVCPVGAPLQDRLWQLSQTYVGHPLPTLPVGDPALDAAYQAGERRGRERAAKVARSLARSHAREWKHCQSEQHEAAEQVAAAIDALADEPPPEPKP
jgi:hypothetical protein